MSFAYRGLDHVVEERFAQIAERRREEIAAASRACAIYARRVGRSVGGGVALAGALVLFGVAAANAIQKSSWWHTGDYVGLFTYALAACWGGAIVAYVAATAAARLHVRGLVAAPLERTWDAARDLARLETSTPGRIVERLAAPLEGWSAALPLAAMSFLMPLTLHFFVAEILAKGDLLARSYDEWISLSVTIVGHAHLVLAIFAWRYGRKLAVRESIEIVNTTHSGWLRAFGFTVLAGAIPGAIFFLIPPILVALTGAAFIPAMFILTSKRVVRERGVLEEACGA